MGLEVTPHYTRERRFLQVQLAHKPLAPRLLQLQWLEAPRLINLKASILRTSVVITLVRGLRLAAIREHILALVNLDFDLALLGHDLSGFQSNTFWQNLILSKDKNTHVLSLILDQFLNAVYS